MMLKIAVVLFMVMLALGLILIFFHSHHMSAHESGHGEALFLTPYLKNGSTEKAKEAARVRPLEGGTESYAGFLTVDEVYDSNMFFWYFPAEEEPATAPVAVWLQGGPGVSSLYGLFLENGPYRIIGLDSVNVREDYWSKYVHVIYIDSSVGTGFSFTRNESGYSEDRVSVAENLYKALLQFFLIFPNLTSNDFYVTGESYGGKYVPALSGLIHESNGEADIKINLKGLSIGNGMIDPVHQMVFSDHLYQISLIDASQKLLFERYQRKIVALIKLHKWTEAYRTLSELITSEFGDRTLFTNVTGFENLDNYLVSEDMDIFQPVNRLMGKPWLRRRIHVGNYSFTSSGRNRARRKMDGDVMKSGVHWLEQLMDHYRVLLYSGQLDLFLPYLSTESFIKRSSWCASSSYSSSERSPWFVDGLLAGYTKTVSHPNCSGSLTLALVRNAGHQVSRDQPVWTLDLIRKFTQNTPFS